MQHTDGLRHQLVTPEQTYIYDYWRSLCDGDTHPNRQDLDPAVLRRHLPFISIYERGADNSFSVRLAGTGFWNFFGHEIQGRELNDLPLGEGVAYWNRVLSHVTATGEAMAGATRAGTPIGGDLHQLWLRLPLFGEDGGMVLGFDQFLRAPQTAATPRQTSPLMRPVFGHGAPMLAGV